jgi:DNA-binding PadR family transcriptional regulator
MVGNPYLGITSCLPVIRPQSQTYRPFARNTVASSQAFCYYYYVTRSTHDVAGQDPHLGRYSDPPLLVLTSLADGPKHGHAMIQDIVRMSGTRLGPGTLYGAIARLEREKLIEPLPVEERRQPYRLTAKGLRVLRAKLATLSDFASAGLRKLEAR